MGINIYIEIYATVNPCDKPLDHVSSNLMVVFPHEKKIFRVCAILVKIFWNSRIDL